MRPDPANNLSPERIENLLFAPARVGGLDLANRIVMAPMTRCFCPGGVPGPDVAAYYRRRAEADVGLIITEGAWIPHPAASNDDNAPRFYGEDALDGWRRVVAEVHAVGGKIAPQLWHVGLTRKPVVEHLYAQAAEDFSGRASPSGYVMPGEKVGEGLSLREVDELIAAYAAGARTAKQLGFDAVEIHGAHGYVVDQFFWGETNKRKDRWGGDLAERARFGAELIRACRAEVGREFPIILRFSQWKLQDYDARLANTPQELERFLTPLADAGVDIFHASQRRFWIPEFADAPLNLAGWTKRLTGRPTITVGSVGLEREMLETMFSPDACAPARIDTLLEMLERGDFDLVAVGRAVLADPDWAAKVRRGAWSDLTAFHPQALASLA